MRPRETAEPVGLEEEGGKSVSEERPSTRDAATPELFEEYGRTRDPELREQLILAHSNLVRYLARKFANRGEPLEDLIQVGMIGLMNAIDRFDSSRGIRFATYATPTIMGEIRRHFRDRGWAVKVPRRLQELSLAANKAIDGLTQELDRAPTVAEIASRLEVSEQEALEAMELGDLYELPSLDTALRDESEDSRGILADYVGGIDEEMERFESRARLAEALSALPPRERSIIELRFLAGLSQTEVARRLRMSQMHVSRLQHRALQRLREVVRDQDAA
ncbi:MAG: SigB/SigF/SigG family RNA polymerase sigma factor [Armatimonadota bacterium]|nr:MAG: SigB/SigF/SigG family RNA polymerase sigma factor [Armatimonadota bacterium]